MMSINGMISIRAFLCGMGELTCMTGSLLSRAHLHAPRLILGFQHNLEIRRSGLQFELQVRHPGGEEVERNQTAQDEDWKRGLPRRKNAREDERENAHHETIEIETAPNPQWSVIFVHGLGADGNDFVPWSRK